MLFLKENFIFFNLYELDGLLFLKLGKFRFFLFLLDVRELLFYYLNNMEVEFFENFIDKIILIILDIVFIVEKNSEIFLILYLVLNFFRNKYSIMEKFLYNLIREKFFKFLLLL